MTNICFGKSFEDAKMMVQNRTTSNFAEDERWVGLHGSLENIQVAAINHRKPPTEAEVETYRMYPPRFSQILDQVFIEPAVITI